MGEANSVPTAGGIYGTVSQRGRPWTHCTKALHLISSGKMGIYSQRGCYWCSRPSSPLLNISDQSLSKLIYFQPNPLNTLIATQLFSLLLGKHAVALWHFASLSPKIQVAQKIRGAVLLRQEK